MDGARVSGRRIGGGVRTDGEPMTRECMELLEIQKGWRWVVSHAGCNGEARVRGHNACVRADWVKQTLKGCDLKGSGAGQDIRLVPLNIW